MKKPNRRSKRCSVSDFTPPAAVADAKESEQLLQRLHDLEKENEALKIENEELKLKAVNRSPSPIDGLRKMKEDTDSQQLRFLEDQVTDLKKKFNGLSQLSARRRSSSHKQKNGDAGFSSQDQIQRLKVQKVQLLCKIKLESVQFRLSKASLEKENLQLKKQERRKDYEIRKLLALNEKQRLVLQRKTEEASMATKRLKELLESRKASDSKSGKSPGLQGIEIELKFAEKVEELRANYEREMEEMAEELRKFEEEAEDLRFLLQGKEVDCTVRDSELKDLKDELAKLSNMVNQLGIQKAEVPRKKLEVDLVRPSISSASSVLTEECSGGNTGATGISSQQICCSCSKKSLCKTSKCECRAAGESCGAECGCTSSKCSNRSVLAVKVDDSLEKMAGQDSIDSSVTSGLLEPVVSGPSDLDNHCVVRKPLHDIGNSLVNSSPAPKPGKNRRGKKPLKLDTVEPPEDAEGLGNVEAVAVDDKKVKFTRPKRLQISK